MNAPLELVRRLFGSLESEGIRHAIWKGSSGLAEALAGEKDLDLLVEQHPGLDDLLDRAGFRRVVPQPWSAQSGVEDWIGVDADSGTLVHLHLYHDLIVGRRFVEEYRLPWKEIVLSGSRPSERFGVHVCDPSLEIILLGIRIAHLATGLSAPAVLLGRSRASVIQWQKLTELRERVDEASVRRHAFDLLGSEDGHEFADIVLLGDTRSRKILLRLRAIVLQQLSRFRRFSTFQANLTYGSRAAMALVARAKRKAGLFSQTKKRLEGEGVVVAIIGSDGSGKSTVARELVRWLRWKIDAHAVYLGSGDGAVSFPVRILKSLAAKARSSRSDRPSPASGVPELRRPRKRSTMRDVGAGLLALAVGNDRLRKVKKAHEGRQKGSVMVTDRYPQMQYPGIYDGPKLVHRAGASAVRRYFQRLEERRYREMEKLPPDVVIRLHVPVAVALRRKPDHDDEEIRRKAELTGRIEFPGAKVVDVDSSAPLEDVLRRIKKIVWESI